MKEETGSWQAKRAACVITPDAVLQVDSQLVEPLL